MRRRRLELGALKLPRRRPLRLLFRSINSLVGLVLRSPLHPLLSGRLALLTFYGHKSGRRYTIPVGYVQTHYTLLVDAESAWWKNLRGGVRVGIRLRGEERTGTSEAITDEVGMVEAYATMLALVPGYGRALGISLGSDGRPKAEDVALVRRKGHAVIRIQLDP